MLDSDFVLITDNTGVVKDIAPLSEAGQDVQILKGILTPGFVNCHCHLELSHLKNVIPEKTGLVDFVFSVVTQRHFREEIILEAIARGEDEMIANGIVAVGDICNTTNTLIQKQKKRLAYYNFIEVSGWSPAIAQARFEQSKSFFDQFVLLQAANNRCAMAPHAPYSVSEKLWELIQPFFDQKTTSVHNQESPFENEFFLSGSGDFLRMYSLLNIDNRFYKPSGKSSLQSFVHHMECAKNVLLVHNTFINKEDIHFIKNKWKSGPKAFFCLCPNANLYIEDALPPVESMAEQGVGIVLGTDSLASNGTLSIMEELKTIISHFPGIPHAQLLQWATSNGAQALQMENELGSFSAGKKPGVLLIYNTENSQLTPRSAVQKIL